MQKKNTVSYNLASVVYTPASFFVFFGTAFLFFDIQYLIMSQLPGTLNEMCVMGAGLNLPNMLFAFFTSTLMGLLGGGVFLLYQVKKFSLPAVTSSGFGALLGMLTIFCPVCTFPLISLFGISIGMTFFTAYDVLIKIFSLVFIALGLFELNRQLRGACRRCVN